MPGKLGDSKGTENVAPAPPAAASFPLEELAWQCTKNAIAVSQYLSANELPQPSHEPDAPSSTLPKDAPPNIRRARQSLMNAALQLFQLAAGPSEFIPNLAPGFQYVACLSWLLRYDIFHLVPASGSISYRDLATAASRRANSAADIPEARLKSIVRMAMTSALFREPEPNRVGHSATSALLARDADVHSWASYLSTRSAPTALSMAAAHDKFTPASVAKNETAYNVAFDTHLPFFDHLALDPANTAEFAGYMRNVTTSEAVDVKHLVNGYPWADLGHGLVVDVGGSTGNADIALAKSFPDLRFIVQDLPDNASAGREAAEANLPSDILSRISFQGHDFTKPQPVAGADVYLLRMILHDWPDHVAITILKQLVPVLENKKAKLIIMDTVLPAPGQVPGSVERIVRVRDLTMMQVFNSHERDLDQWKALLAAADEGLRLRRVMEPYGSAMSLLEVELDRDFQEEEEESWAISG
ncbi:sterigmatocystin 8-O-methyltransferase [Talaromyces proteolyticus]|uniref:Sterigmatocystin 8-O-methyltransferase n=1 Tax=Talaromyces proteolyticus TaxID=1131652 RepID=A0AAD4KTI9_9EURO|nr:sterigmatocystin 8-O-methyltransferase [Talaromyces proteolyticus]KAH8698978.1 sterigmatocystin 8-O-methyltransferase [Talaromyces proteolyticus]